MPSASVKKSKKVPVPLKPWSAIERSAKMTGTVAAPGHFFEQVYIEKGYIAGLGKKGRIGVSARTLNRLIENPEIPNNLKQLLQYISEERRVNFGERALLAEINSLTKTLNRQHFSADEFSFLENLRVGLIEYLRDKFGQ